jgi:protein-S-isoprenylcysteine O-methyltransferase Ste14
MVVEGGPYRWERRPSYSGLLISFVGLGLGLSDWLSVIVLAILPAAGLIIRIQSEERALLTGLVEEYRRYAATRRREPVRSGCPAIVCRWPSALMRGVGGCWAFARQ